MSVHFNVHRVVLCCGICVQDNSKFATVDVMVETINFETAVIANLGDSAVEVDSSYFAAMTQIDCVIKEDGTTEGDAGRAHPPQCAVRIDDGRCEIATRSFSHDVVVAQIGAICASLQDRRILVSTWIIEGGSRDCEVSL